MILDLYRIATSLGGPLILRHLKKRLAKGKEHPARFQERLGIASLARPQGQVIWLHGASVGEAVSLLPLIERLVALETKPTILVTTGTVTSAALMEKRLPHGAIHQFVPVDRLVYVKRFLDHWQPDLALWAESEFWPNLVQETAKREITMVLVNGRISNRSFQRWQKFSNTIATLLGCFDLCLGQTDEDTRRLAHLGAKATACSGNLKFAAPALPYDDVELAHLKKGIADRPTWMAASTHDGEEVLLGRIHNQLRGNHPEVLTIIAPRHPERGNAIAQDLRSLGLVVAQRSLNEDLAPETDVYVADTLGELGLFFRLCPIVFMGKSLQPLGGQNPLEPARLDCAILHGPFMTNFEEIMAIFKTHDASITVEDEAALAQTLDDLFHHPEKCHDLGQRAQQVAHAQQGVLDQTMAALLPFLTTDQSSGSSHAGT